MCCEFFVCLFVCFCGLCVASFLLACLLTCLFVRSFVRSFVCLFVYFVDWMIFLCLCACDKQVPARLSRSSIGMRMFGDLCHACGESLLDCYHIHVI